MGRVLAADAMPMAVTGKAANTGARGFLGLHR